MRSPGRLGLFLFRGEMTGKRNTTNKNRYKRGMNPNSLRNLHPFKKGEPRYRPGRPCKADCLLDCIKDELGKKSLNGVTTKEQMIASALVSMAEKGNLKAIEILMSYTTAKPVAGIDLTSKGKALELIVRWDGNASETSNTSAPATPISG